MALMPGVACAEPRFAESVFRGEALHQHAAVAAGRIGRLPGGNKRGAYWLAASDGQTPTAALTYNVRLGTTAGRGEIISAQFLDTIQPEQRFYRAVFP